MSRPKFIQARDTTLKAGISATESSEIVLRDLVDLYGNALSMTDFGDTGYITINPGNTNEEIISFTSFTVNSDSSVSIDTGITRSLVGVSPYASGGTASAHGAGDIVVVSNNPQLYEAILDYIDGIAIAGSPDATLTSKGLVESGTAAEIDADTQAGSTGADLSTRPDQLALSKYGTQLPSAAEKAGISGLSGTNTAVGTTNDTTQSADLQTQTTSTNTIEAGEADATTKKNSLGQSFVASKEKMRGFRLFKKADTGSFTGTVTVSLQADTTGAPSGTPLATVTISNAAWLLLAAAEFEAVFASEYASMTIGDTYWIDVQPSTSDNANHINLGADTSGGDGNVYYNNTTDGWVQIASADLYYKTMEGNASQVVKTASDGKIDNDLIDWQSYSSGVTTQDTSSTTTSTFAHGLGVVPSRVRITGTYAGLSGTVGDSGYSVGTFDGTTNSGVFSYSDTGTGASGGTSTTYAVQLYEDAGQYLQGVVSVDATNVSITWTKTGAVSGNAFLLWEAWGII